MKRPTYETDRDLLREETVAKLVAFKWNCEPVKMPKFYQVDWAMTREGVVKSWVEIKCRNNPSTKYPTLILSLHKWHALVGLDEHPRIAILVAAFEDGIKYFRAQKLFLDVRIGGRVDRGDAQDIEPVVHIPIKDMKDL